MNILIINFIIFCILVITIKQGHIEINAKLIQTVLVFLFCFLDIVGQTVSIEMRYMHEQLYGILLRT